ncbi:hypothetical protein ACLB2K_002435 [Fragaria x ananassa]
MEKLSHLINSVVDMGYWKPVRASQSGPKVSHLFFADDLMLFVEASPQQASIIKDCLDSFCDLSGQAVMKNPSSYVLLIPVKIWLAVLAGPVDLLLLTTWENIWGCLLSILESISIPMMKFWKKFKTGFLVGVGDSNEKKKIHLVNWKSVCKPKHRGGLGLKKTADMNQAMLAKASWRIFQNDHGLWADIYRKKYLQDCCIESSNSIAPTDCSNTWRGIVHGVELMRRNLKWRIGDGAKIKFWCDLWIISVPSGFGVSGHDKLIWNATANVLSQKLLWSLFSDTMFSWCKPPENFYKLNIDGSRSSSSGCIGAGGVLRDHLGIWIDGFQVYLGTSEVLDVEAWGLFFGLRMVAMHNIVNLEIESNSAVLVQLMLKSDTGVHPLGSLLDSCSVMMSKLLNVSIKHIFRECNMVADALAKNSINHDLGLISFDVVPAHAIQAVLDDLAGVTRARRTGCCSSL